MMEIIEYEHYELVLKYLDEWVISDKIASKQLDALRKRLRELMKRQQSHEE